MSSITYTVGPVPFTSDIVDPVVDTSDSPLLPDENNIQYRVMQSTLTRMYSKYYYDTTGLSPSFVSWLSDRGLQLVEYVYYFVPAGMRTGPRTHPLSSSVGSTFLMVTKGGSDSAMVWFDVPTSVSTLERSVSVAGESRVFRLTQGVDANSLSPVETLYPTEFVGYVLNSQKFCDVRTTLSPMHVWCFFLRDKTNQAIFTQQELALRLS
jgi:hypothetical protein